MSRLNEGGMVAGSRARWVLALAAMAVLVVVAALAVAAFVGLDLLRGPEVGPALENGGANPAIVAPAPTFILPDMYEPPSEWDDRVG